MQHLGHTYTKRSVCCLSDIQCKWTSCILFSNPTYKIFHGRVPAYFSYFISHSVLFHLPPPLPHICLQYSKLLLTSGPLYEWFPLPGMFFLQLFAWFAPCHTSGLNSNISFSDHPVQKGPFPQSLELCIIWHSCFLFLVRQASIYFSSACLIFAWLF